MLQPVKKSKLKASSTAPFVIIASKYNPRYVEGMLHGAMSELRRAGADKPVVIRVPGAFEIPVVAAKLLRNKEPSAAIICLGVILRGQTTHAQQVADAVSASLAQLQIQHASPIIHEVLLLDNEAQAIVRCLEEKHNRGAEAARTALEMARLMELL